MIKNLRERLISGGLYPWLGAGAAIVIVVFGIVAFLGSQRVTPNTGHDAGLQALTASSGSPSASASVSPTATASAATSASHPPAATPTSAAPPLAHGVLLDKSGQSTWESPQFKAPSRWTISYAYDCGGRGGHLTVAVFGDTIQESPIDTSGGRGSGSAVVNGGGNVTIATDTESYCTWHVTARG